MKTLNAKRIASVAAGAALLGVGLAFAGSMTFQNVPIISNSGQPLVQIVVGSSAAPSDGVAAANIAAAIGNLAYTSVPVTASINATQAMNALQVSVSSSKYSLTNQKVWLNESGTAGSVAGTYSFSALIGSVLNNAVPLSAPASTKFLQTGNQYAYLETTSITTSPSPVPSPYTASGSVPSGTVTASTSGGGVTFTSLSKSSYDNIMQVTASQFTGLVSGYGGNGETESLWLTGFPVFDQGSTGALVNAFQLAGAGGAWQASFSKPVQLSGTATSSTTSVNNLNIPIRLLGQNWTILGGYGAGSTNVGSSSTIAGGRVTLASSLTPQTTVYVGRNITAGNFTVALQDLGLANSNGVSPASVAIYYLGKLTNQTSIMPGNTVQFNVSGHTLNVKVNATFAGYYQYQKWAKMQAFSNVYNLTNGQVFNQTNDPGWYVNLLWTNTTKSASGNAVALQSIIVYNTTPTTLNAGQSFSFIQNPSAQKLTFVGDTLGTSGYDQLTASTGSATTIQYQNLGNSLATGGLSIKNVTEPTAELSVSSQIPNAFTYAGQSSSTVTYALNPYQLNEMSNQLDTGWVNALTGTVAAGAPTVSTNAIFGASNVMISYDNEGAANWITSTDPLTVTVTGYTSNTATAPTTSSVVFTSNSQGILTTQFYNVTGIKLNRPLPGGPLSIAVVSNAIAATGADTGNVITLAVLANVVKGGAIIYPSTITTQYQNALSFLNPGANQVVYNQQSGLSSAANTMTLSATWDATGAGPAGTALQQYYTYAINEIAVPTNTAAVDTLAFGIVNTTAGMASANPFQLNYSANFGSNNLATGARTNMTYMSTASGSTGAVNKFNVQPLFRTERGSKFASMSPTQVVLNLAKSVDTLQFAVSQSATVVAKAKASTYGPYGIGQATNLANVSIANVSATIGLGSASNYTITGIANIVATPSVTSAVTPVWLQNLTTTPLVVLDSAANSGSNLVLVGSGYVNTLSAQLQKAYNISVTPTFQQTQAYGTNRVLVAGYTAAQTTAAANAFIQQLYAAAATSHP